MHRRRLLCSVAALGAFVLSAGASQAATGWTASPATGVTGAVNAFSDTDAWALGANGALGGAFAHWNGSSWTQVPGPSGLGFTQALSDDGPTDAWAVGFIVTGYASIGPRIAHWNGSAWSVSGGAAVSGSVSVLQGVTSLGPANAWAVGSDGQSALVEHWNGTAWTRVSVPDPSNGLGSFLSTVAATPSGDVWAVGGFDNPAPQPESLYALHYDGSAWHLVTMAQTGDPSASDYPHAAQLAAISANDVWMVGTNGNSSSQTTLTEHWNGSAWSIVPSPFNQVQSASGSTTYGTLLTVTARGSNDVWAGGYTSTLANGASSPVNHPLLIHWDGTSWTQDTSAPTTGSGSIGGISTTLGGHVIWATNSGTPSLLEHS